MITAGFAFECRGVKPPSARALRSAPTFTSAVITAGFALPLAAQMQRRQATLSPHLEIRSGVQKRGDNGGIRVR